MRLPSIVVFAFFLQITQGCIYLKLKNGIIKGRVSVTADFTKIFCAFQQIPYAKAPVGNLRFQPPLPYPKWNHIIDATKNTKICFQSTSDSPMESEDCLYLNVYTPNIPSIINKKLVPVMVFIHGGGFIIGDSTHKSYGPEFFMNYDVVIVTLNYRLGPFGFLSTQDKVLPGNNGLKDQLLALQWVNENIESFGGDKSKITLFGQSAGAASVSYHLLNGKSKGLFRAAIMESGSALCPFSYQRDARNFALRTATYVNNGSLATNSSEEILQVMLKAPAKKIDEVSNIIASNEETYDNVQLFQGYYYAPVIEDESENAFLTEKMYESMKNGNAHRIPIIIGTNSEESLSQTTDTEFVKKWMALYDNNLGALVPKDMNIDNNDLLIEVGSQIRTLYSGENLLQENPAYGIRYMSDTAFMRPIVTHALLQSIFSDVYFYQFDYDGKMGNVSIIVEGTNRVGHNEENAYLWRISNDMFYNYDLSIFPKEDLVTHQRLLTLWTNFAKTLNPTFKKDDLLQNILWPKVSPNDGFQYLHVGENLEIRINPTNWIYKVVYEYWRSIYEEFGKEPFDTY